MKSPDEKNAMCQACMDTDGRFSYCCDYLHHNDKSLKSKKNLKCRPTLIQLSYLKRFLSSQSLKSACRLVLNKIWLFSFFFLSLYIFHKWLLQDS